MAEEGAEDWDRVARYVNDRMELLSLAPADIDRAGVSPKTLAGIRTGARITRMDVRRNLALALGWTANSVTLIARGGEPAERSEHTEAEIASLRAEVRELRRQLADELRRTP